MWLSLFLNLPPVLTQCQSVSYSFALNDHSGCSTGMFFCLHCVGRCWAKPVIDFHIIFFILFTQLFGTHTPYRHTGSQTHVRTHRLIYTLAHTHMVAFILSTPQSASCGSSCLGWERRGPETNRMSRGVWTVTVLMGTFNAGQSSTKTLRVQTVNSQICDETVNL